MGQPELVFELTCVGAGWESLDYGGPPELSVFFPAGSDCRQLNYGQGEGQVLIDGHEWGVYYNDRGNLDVVLHSGDLSIEDAQLVVSRICAQLSKRLGVAVQFSLTSPHKPPPSSQ